MTYDLINRMGCESNVPFRSRTETCSRPEDCVLESVISQNLCVFLELRFRMPVSRWAEGIRDQNQKAKTKTKKELVIVDLFDVMVIFSVFGGVVCFGRFSISLCVCLCAFCVGVLFFGVLGSAAIKSQSRFESMPMDLKPFRLNAVDLASHEYGMFRMQA